MKRLKIFLTIVIVVLIIPLNCIAKDIVNQNGVVMSENDYNNFLKVYTPEYIMNMTQEKYNKLSALDFTDIRKETKYVETTYNRRLNLVTEKEITEEEYDNFIPGVVVSENRPMVNSDSAYSETSAKRLEIAIIGGTVYNPVILSNIWKGIPSTREFDVIGVRLVGFDVRNGSQFGEQSIKLDDTWSTIFYDWDEDHIKKLDNGFGFAMNIVNNSNLKGLQLNLECDVKQTASHPELFGSYQHAVAKTTMNEALNFTLGSTGLGAVFVYPYSISHKYDGETGVRLQY